MGTGVLAKGPAEAGSFGPAEVELSARQRAALEAICDTLAPRGEGMPSAADLDVAGQVVRALGMNPRAGERRQTAMLLSAWDSPLLTALGGGGLRRFAALPADERERVLLSWCDSRLPRRRAVFQALRRAVLLMYYLTPEDAAGRPNPAWEAIGYPGPLGPPPEPRPKPIRPLAVEADTALECDVCVVGSGAGGGTAAGVLAAAGLDVVVLESGGYYDEEDFDGAELSGFRRMYLNGGGAATADQSVGLLAGTCLGGGTTINYGTSFRTPGEVREEWAAHGVPAFAGEDYTRSLDAVVERLGVNREHSRPSARDEMVRRGLERLGWHVDRMPRNAGEGCDQGPSCGACGYGCRMGAKRSTARTWLEDAHEAGARILVRTRAERVRVDGGRARGVEARTLDGHAVTVSARAVVAACGAIGTPALLRRSGLTNPGIGRNLRLHPATPVWGVFDEEIRGWEGTTQAIYSDQHRHLRSGYGVKYETAPMHPSLLVAFGPWRGSRPHAEMMRSLPFVSGVGALLRDHGCGEVRVGRDGQPVAHYALSRLDREHLRTGIEGAARIMEAAGARRIFSSQSRRVAYEPGRRGSLEGFMRDADACGYGTGRCTLYSFHIMGTARMGGTPEASACSPAGETWDARDLYVCDASAFPTASGVNPMISIEAIAHMTAAGIAARLG